jgi:hypothetical protein
VQHKLPRGGVGVDADVENAKANLLCFQACNNFEQVRN